ncbi:hypothetical protein [Candidatus Mesenet endosymbiont of Agriotes lineatus]|uniref:hypothetical protein n=1 Tax=Candidatus Mesenet endosymbiont of Agriotes lineatus TaxID=3077948 RepID=UPI0030CC9915
MLNSRLKDNENFIYLLKEYNCPEEVISGILKFSDRDFNLLLSRIKDQSDLLTALIENGYGSEAFKSVFCQKDDEVYNTFVKYKEFIILLLENKCELKSIECVYDLVKYNTKPHRIRNLLEKCFPVITTNFMGHCSEINIATEVYDYFVNRKKIVSKLSSLLQSSEIFKSAWEFISSNNIKRINAFRENPQLFYLIMKNGIINNIALKRLLERDDYKNLNIRDNKQLLDFLLNEKLIALDQAKQGFVANYLLLPNLLRTGNIIVSELQNKSIEEITQKVRALAEEQVNKDLGELKLPSNLTEQASFSYIKKSVPPLQIFAVVAAVEYSQNRNF